MRTGICVLTLDIYSDIYSNIYSGRHVDTQLSTSVEEPRPPDPRLRLPLRVNKAVNGIRDVESQMPPKIRMRKRWTQTHGQGDVPLYEREDISMQTSVPAPILAAGSMDVDDDTTPQASENGRVGLGIRLEGQPAPVSTTTLVRGTTSFCGLCTGYDIDFCNSHRPFPSAYIPDLSAGRR